jgi:insertion element IS1 protein InsB
VRKVYQALKNLYITEFCTDHWKAFQGVFPTERNSIGKVFTRQIEGVNTSIRARNRRFVRKICCFSKKNQHHDAAIAMVFAYRNGCHKKC